MKKFLLVRDFKVNANDKPFEYDVIEAESIYQAIDIAEDCYIDETVYLSLLCEKVGNVEKGEYGEKVTTYHSVLAKRSCGWNRTTAHGESEVFIQEHRFNYGRNYEFIR